MTPNAHEAGKVSELRPCPFCGEDAIIKWVNDERWFFPACTQCGARGRTHVGALGATEAEAIAAWNRRAESQTGAVDVPDIKLVIADYLELRDESIGAVSSDEERSASAIQLYDAIQRIHAKLAPIAPEHVLYETGDMDAPDVIKDSNGEVVLDLCRVCNRGEIELTEPCTPAVPADVHGVAVKPLDLSALLRHAFLEGRGLARQQRLSQEDQDAWTSYNPEGVGPYERIHAALSDYQRLAAENERLREERDEYKRAALENSGNIVAWLIAQVEAAEGKLAEAVSIIEEMVDTLTPGEHASGRDPAYGDEVRLLGLRIGFGAMMSSASTEWRRWLEENGYPLGSEFVSGPCRSVLQSDLAAARTFLASLTTPPTEQGET